jgi:regulatory protein
MKVTKLSSQKKDSSRVNMYIDGEFFCGLSLDAVAKFNIYDGKEVDIKELDDILFEELKSRFSQRALSYVSKRIKTEYQLRRYLKTLSFKKKGSWYNDIPKDKLQDIFDEVVKKLDEYGYINDEDFAEQFILSRIKNRPRGKTILVSELISKGVDKEIARSKVDELVGDEYEILKKTYEKRYRGEKITIRDRKKIDYLKRKGFRWDLIKKLIDNESSK